MRMRNVVTGIAVCGGLWCGMAAPCPAAEGSQRWALLVGVDHYDYARGLKYCVADQQALSGALVKAGFEARQVTLMTDSTADKKLWPSKVNLKTQIELLCQLADKGDFVLIGFSGHGVLIEKGSYLCPSDAKLDDADTLISLDWVYKQLRGCKADLRLMMVDACRNVPPEPEGRRAATPKELQATSRAFAKEAERLPEGVLLLNSCSEGEFAQEHDPLGHGVFTHFLLEGLQGKADKDANKRISLQELFSYSTKETSLYVRDKFAGIQRPKLMGNYAFEVMEYELASLSVVPTNSSKLPELAEFLLLTSASAGERSHEDAELGHGVFTHFLLEGIRGPADADQDGLVSVLEITKYACNKTKLHVSKIFNDSQRPAQKGNISLKMMECPLFNVANISTKDKVKSDPKRWALLIGVDNYANANDLKYCGADVRALGDEFRRSGFADDHVFILHDDAKDKRYLPFKSNIEKQLDLVVGMVEKDDIVVLVFSGHGANINGKSYLTPTDAKLDDPTTLLSMDWVCDLLKKSEAALKIVLLDAGLNEFPVGTLR